MDGFNASFGNATVGNATAFSRPSYTNLNYTSSFLNPTIGVSTKFSSSHVGDLFSRGQSSSLSGSTWRPASATLPTKFSSTSFRNHAPLSSISRLAGPMPVHMSSSFSQSLLPSSFGKSSFANNLSANQVPSLADPPLNQGAHACMLACVRA